MTVFEYNTYDDYVAARAKVGMGVIPKTFFDNLKLSQNDNCFPWDTVVTLNSKTGKMTVYGTDTEVEYRRDIKAYSKI